MNNGLLWSPANVHLTSMKLRTILLTLPVSGAFILPAVAQTPADTTAAANTAAPVANEPGSNLTVYLLTFGWGDVVCERFGHNASWIRDRTPDTDQTDDW